jgi:hypothetical protein
MPAAQREDYGATQPDWYLLRLNCTGCLVYGGGTVDGQARRWVVGRWPQQKVVLNFNDSSCELPLECRQGLTTALERRRRHWFGLTKLPPPPRPLHPHNAIGALHLPGRAGRGWLAWWTARTCGSAA